MDSVLGMLCASKAVAALLHLVQQVNLQLEIRAAGTAYTDRMKRLKTHRDR
jgi:hypothetical protein